MRLAELEHRKRKLEEAERASEARLAAASREAIARVGSASQAASIPLRPAKCSLIPAWSSLSWT